MYMDALEACEGRVRGWMCTCEAGHCWPLRFAWVWDLLGNALFLVHTFLSLAKCGETVLGCRTLCASQ